MRRRDLVAAFLGACVVLPLVATAALTPDNSGMVFPYRGHLDLNGAPYNGSADLAVNVYKSAADLTPCHTSGLAGTPVVGGEFSVVVGPLAPACIAGATGGLYLEVSVKTAADATPVLLTGRQRVLPVPLAMGSAPSSVFNLLGNLGMGVAQPTAAIHVEKAWGAQTDPMAGLAMLYNTSNTAGAHASLGLRVGGSAAGNPFISMDIANETGWSIGVDNADNTLKMTPSWAGPTAVPAAITVDGSGNTWVKGALATGGLTPDWDSGWVPAAGNVDTTLTHNLGVIPRQVSVQWRNAVNAAWVTPAQGLYDEGAFSVNGPTVGVSAAQLRFRVRGRPTSYFHYDENGNYSEGALPGNQGQFRFLAWR